MLVAEQFLEPVTRDLHARERRLELGGDVAHDVVDVVVANRDAQLVARPLDVEPARAQRAGERRDVVVELEHEAAASAR